MNRNATLRYLRDGVGDGRREDEGAGPGVRDDEDEGAGDGHDDGAAAGRPAAPGLDDGGGGGGGLGALLVDLEAHDVEDVLDEDVLVGHAGEVGGGAEGRLDAEGLERVGDGGLEVEAEHGEAELDVGVLEPLEEPLEGRVVGDERADGAGEVGPAARQEDVGHEGVAVLGRAVGQLDELHGLGCGVAEVGRERHHLDRGGAGRGGERGGPGLGGVEHVAELRGEDERLHEDEGALGVVLEDLGDHAAGVLGDPVVDLRRAGEGERLGVEAVGAERLVGVLDAGGAEEGAGHVDLHVGDLGGELGAQKLAGREEVLLRAGVEAEGRAYLAVGGAVLAVCRARQQHGEQELDGERRDRGVGAVEQDAGELVHFLGRGVRGHAGVFWRSGFWTGYIDKKTKK